MIDLSHVRQAWKLAPILSTWAPEMGTVHRTLLLRTPLGNYALRAYRYTVDQRWKIVCEHRLIAFAYASGLPALAPLPLSTGGTILEHNTHFYALFPFASGYQIERSCLTSVEVSAMGEFLGHLHQTLHGYPPEEVPYRSFTVDQQATLTKLDEIESALRNRPETDESDLKVVGQLAQRRNWLKTLPAPDMEEFSQLEHQVIHGDYQETNLFFAEGKVCAIIDWDQAYVAPRAWEIVRTLHYALNLEITSCRLFLDAYRRIAPLPTTELEVAATAYGWKRAHDLWQYEELYLRGNQRVRAFFQSGEASPPFAEKWAHIRPFLLEG